MLALPPVPPAFGWVNRVRLGRDDYVRVDSSDYSVDRSLSGRFDDVTADLSRSWAATRRPSRRTSARLVSYIAIPLAWGLGIVNYFRQPDHSRGDTAMVVMLAVGIVITLAVLVGATISRRRREGSPDNSDE